MDATSTFSRVGEMRKLSHFAPVGSHHEGPQVPKLVALNDLAGGSFETITISRDTTNSLTSLLKTTPKTRYKKSFQSRASVSAPKDSMADFSPLLDFSQYQPPDYTPAAEDAGMGFVRERGMDVVDTLGVLSFRNSNEHHGAPVEKKKKPGVKKHRQKALAEGNWVRPMRIDLKQYQLEDLHDAFIMLLDRSELMNLDQVKNILRACGYDPDIEELKEFVESILQSNEESFTLPELTEIFREKLKKEDLTDEIRRAFRLFDLDDKKAITLDNLVQVTEIIGENFPVEELSEMISTADVEKKGCVTMDNFVKFMKKREYFDQE